MKVIIKWILGATILTAEMEIIKSIHREWKWTRDHSIMTPLKTVLKKIIIQILITKLNIDKNLAINKSRIIMRAIVHQTWGTPKEKLIRQDIMAKGWTLKTVSQEKATTSMKNEGNMATRIWWKMKVSIKMDLKISNKISNNPKIWEVKITNLLWKRNKMKDLNPWTKNKQIILNFNNRILGLSSQWWIDRMDYKSYIKQI